MSKDQAKRPSHRPRALPVGTRRSYVNLPPALDEQIRALAKQEHRPINSQIAVLLERGLRSYGLEVAAA